MTLRLGQRRYDETIPVSSVETTPAGGRRMRASLSRVGVFKYRYADGTEVREYRPPEEVLAPASIASWDGAVVTDEHPDGLVTPQNMRVVARGRVHKPTVDGSYVAGVVDVDDAETIAKIDAGKLLDVSGGYTADFDPTPGTTPDGEPYDGRQTNIRANHLALLPPGAGRQGPTVALRLDSSSAIASCIRLAPATPTQETKTMPKIKLDGIDYEVGSESHLSALEKQASDARKRADDNATLVTSEKARADAAEAKLVEQVAKAKAETERADAAEAKADPKALAKRVAERVGLLTIARSVLGPTYLADAAGAEPGEAAAGVDDDTVIRAVLKGQKPNLDTSKMTHEMLMGALLASCEKASSAESLETELDAAAEPAAPVAPAVDPSPTAFDSQFAPRGQIGAPNAARAAQGEQIRTQEQALEERRRADADAWRKPTGAHLPQS